MKEAMASREDGALMVKRSCGLNRNLGSLDRVQQLRNLTVLIYIRRRNSINQTQAHIPVHVSVGRRERDLEWARYSRVLFNFLTLASNSVTRSRSAAHRNVT